MSMNHTGNVQPAIDREEHTHPFGEGAFGAKMVVEPMPAATKSQKLTYDGSSRVTLVQIATDSWDNRGTTVYS